MAVMRQDTVIPSFGNNLILKQWDLTGVVTDPTINTITTSNQVVGNVNDVIVSEVSNPILDAYTNFLGLKDTPNDYAGNGGKVTTVKPDETGLEFKTINQIADSRYVKKSGDTMTGNLIVNNSDKAELQLNAGTNKDAVFTLTEAGKQHGVELLYHGSHSGNRIYLNAIQSGVKKPIFQADRAGTEIDFEARPQYKNVNILTVTENDARYVQHSEVVNVLNSTSTNAPLSAAMGRQLQNTVVKYTDVKNNLTSTDTNKPLAAAQGKALKALVDDRYTKTQSDTKYARKRNASDIGSGTANSNKILHGDMVWRDQTVLSTEVLTGTLAARPTAAASNKGDFYVVSGDSSANNGKMYISDGTNWILVEHAAASYTKAQADSRFLGINAKAQSAITSDQLGGRTRAQIVAEARTGLLTTTGTAANSAKLENKTLAQVIADARAGYQTTAQADSKYLLKTGKAANSALFDGKTRSQIISEAQSGRLTQGAADGRYLKLTGGTLTGNVTISSVGSGIVFNNTNYATKDSVLEFKNSANQNATIKHEISDGNLPQAGQGFLYRGNDAAHPVHISTDGEFFAKTNQKVYHTGNKPSAGDVGAYTKTEVNNLLAGKAATGYAYSKQQSDGKYLLKTGKAADSSLLNGVSASSGYDANKIVQRNSSGDVLCRLLRSNYANQTTISGALAYRVNNGSDNYLRYCSSTSAIRTWLSTYSKTEQDGRYWKRTDKVGDANTLDGYDVSQLFRRIDNSTDYKTTANIMSCQQMSNTRPAGLSSGYPYGTLLTINDANTRFRIYAPHNEGGKSAFYFNTGYNTDQKPWQRVMTYSDGDARYLGKTATAAAASKLATARTISLTGDCSGSTTFDGTANRSISVTVNNDSHWHSQIYIPDTRGASRAPNYYPDRYVSWDFQQNTNTGAGGDTWHVVNTIAKWTTYNASHRQEQIAYTGSRIKHRVASSDTAWHGWNTIAFVGDSYSKSESDGRYYRSGSNPSFGEVRASRVECGYNHNQANSVGCSNWFRSSGNTGWYSGTHGGGIYMKDTTYVRTYGGKRFYVDNTDATYAIHTAGGINSSKGFHVSGKDLITGAAGSGAPSASSVAVGGLYVRW